MNNNFSGKKILITGGAGFIGSNLAIRLVEYGAHVVTVDSLIPQYGGNLFNLSDKKDLLTINISDVRDKYSMKYLVQDVDYLFNLAGQTSHLDSMENPFLDLEINSKAQLSILESCRKYNSGIKIVFASTRQLYGRPQYLPVDEKHPLEPVDVNGINKISGEMYHILYNNVYGIKSCALRLTNTYGPGMRVKDARQTFVGIWVKNILNNIPIEVWGGEQLRDFNYVDDVVDAFLLTALSDKSDGKIYNLGSDEVISLRELAEIMINTHDSGEFLIKEFPLERKKIDIGDYYSDFNLIKSDLGWSPKVTIKQGIMSTLKYYNQHMEEYL